MTVVASVAAGVFVALAVGAATGSMPTLRRRTSSWQGVTASGTAVLLRRAGVSGISAAQVRAASAALAALAFLLTLVLTGIPALGIVPAALVGIAPTTLLRRRAAQRAADLRRAWPDALAHIASGARSGQPLSHTLIDLSLNGPAALRERMAGFAARVQTVGLDVALISLRDAVADPVTDRVVEVLLVAHTEGSRVLVDVLDDLSAAVGNAVRAAEETETLALEGVLNARLVFALPWAVLLAMTARPGPFRAFYSGTGGVLVIAIGAIISLLGITIAARLTRPPEEPRVLVAESPS